MPPRSRTKPGSTNRRPKVAGLRQHAHAGAGAPPVDHADAPDLEDRLDAPPESPVERPVEAPVETPTDAAPTAPPVSTDDDAPATASAASVDDPAAASADDPTDAEPDAATARAETTALSTQETDEQPGDTVAESTTVTEDEAETRTAGPTTVTAPRTNRARRGTRMTPRAVPTEDVETARPTRAAKPARVRAGAEAPPRRLVRQREALGRFAGSRALPITLVVAIVVCLVLGGLAFWKGREAWTSGPVSNGAVVDVGGTAELVGQSREAIEKIFSYDFSRLDDSADAARTMSTGQFSQRYMSVFDQTIRQPAQQQQLRQTATVVNIGVTEMRDDRATVMALTQFSAQRTTTGQSTNAPGLLRLDMERVDGRWKLAELTPLRANR
ncbi:hypothetical protein PHK61_08765 [Actinomycetospora lutea]|uniref:hypothetical protein n=1 Tax=Actinomycetospora lutea TaxID=663604 RepID=UPI002365F5F0|nr:hypothetical protein [Actinomycetospora lutea]MDD7938503.1 hypothetical protein [Actinomycetospora lutea]